MIADLHSHVLPGIDDGSSSLEESMEMLKMEMVQGITQVVATPHFYAWKDSPERFLEKRREAELQLRAEMEKYPGLPALHIGAEVHFFRGMSQSDAISDLTIDGKRCILIELDEEPWQEGVYEELERIYRERNMIPVIAHVERYRLPFSGNRHISRLEELPVLIQSNASFFLNKRTRSTAMRMLRQGKIHLLGSDAHNLGKRPPQLGMAVTEVQKKLGPDAIDWICHNQKVVFGN